MIPLEEGVSTTAEHARKGRSRLLRTLVPRPRRPVPFAMLLALAGGLLLAAAFAPEGVWPLAPLGPAFLAVALRRGSPRASFGIGLVFGVAFFFPLLSWISNVAWYVWLTLAVAESLIFGVLAIGQRLLLGTRAWPLGVAGWWVAAEALRDRWPWGGFPWGRIAMSQAGAPTRGWAAIGGTAIVTFVVALIGATLAWAAMSLREPRRNRLVAPLALAATAGVAVLPAAFTLDPVPAQGKTAEIAAIQGNVPQRRTLAAQLNATMVTANHARATLELARKVLRGAPKPDLVVWPENSTDIDPGLDPQISAEITQATDTIGSPVLVGAVLQDPLRNAGQLWLPGRGPTQEYVKRRLVPFGEVIPFRGFLSKITPLTRLQPADFTPGRADVVFRVGNGIRLGDVICYEIGFDDLVRSEVSAGANLLTVQTNDATFERDGQTGETGQQLAMARLRAVEHDRAVVVANTVGYSAIVLPDGRLLSRSGTWRQAILAGRVPLVTHTTLADRAGPWPEYVIVILTAAAVITKVVIAGIQRRRANHQ